MLKRMNLSILALALVSISFLSCVEEEEVSEHTHEVRYGGMEVSNDEYCGYRYPVYNTDHGLSHWQTNACNQDSLCRSFAYYNRYGHRKHGCEAKRWH